MNNLKKTFGQEDDTRALLKNLHKKVYSICRLFTDNYKAHQSLFTNSIAAAANNIHNNKTGEEKQTLFLRACINMTALQSITHGLSPAGEPNMQFKSPDYQKSMVNLREEADGLSDYEKILLFLSFEKWPADKIEELSGLSPAPARPLRPAPVQKTETPRFTPSLKDKLIWI